MVGMSEPRIDRANLIEVLQSLVFYVVFYSMTVLIVLVCALSMLLSKPIFLRAVHSWAAFHRFCVRRFLGIKIRLEGQFPAAPFLFACKHESFFEAIDLPYLLDTPVVFAKAELMQIPVWGYAGRRYGLIAVEREQGASALRAMVSAARALANEGRPVVIFPEGTRVPHGDTTELQSGFAGLYKLLGLPVVPVAVNSGPLYQHWWKRRGTITYRIGEVIPAGLPRDDVEARVRAAINALNTDQSSK